MVSRENILALVQKTIHELFDIDESRIQLDTRFVEDLDMDSIDALELAARIQDLTGERMQDEQIRQMRKVSDVIDVLYAVAETKSLSLPESVA